MALKVKEVARLAGVSVRTLHHYDRLRLVRPSGRSPAGYRLYGPADLRRLQQVLFFRELGFPLAEIRRIVGGRGYDVGAALRLQRRLLGERAVRTRALIEAVDRAIEEQEQGRAMSDQERFGVFGDFDPRKYEAEAEARWGGTPAYAESSRRTARFGKEDWAAVQRESGEIFEALGAVAARGLGPDSEEAAAVAERHRQHVERWFYPCPPAMHAGLGALYVQDARFSATIDAVRPGLAAYARDAWVANAARRG